MEKLAETMGSDGLVHLIGDFFARVEVEGITVAILLGAEDDVIFSNFSHGENRSFQYVSDRREFDCLTDAYRWAARAYIRDCQIYGAVKPVEPSLIVVPGSYHKIEEAYYIGDRAMAVADGWSDRGSRKLKEMREEI